MNGTEAVARRVRELAPGPEVSAVVLEFVRRRGSNGLEDFLSGMLAILDPSSALSRAATEKAGALPEATGDALRTCSAESDRETVLWYVRERLGLREDGEDAHREKFVGTYEDRTDEGDGIWIFFTRKPQADVRKKASAAGFRYRGKPTYGWRHLCGAGRKEKVA